MGDFHQDYVVIRLPHVYLHKIEPSLSLANDKLTTNSICIFLFGALR